MFSQKLLDIGFDAELVDCVIREKVDLGFWTPAGLSEHFTAILDDRFSASWAVVEGDSCFLAHGTGCGAGDPAADAFSCLSFFRVLRWCRTGLWELGLGITMQGFGVAVYFGADFADQPITEMSEPSYADDAAFVFHLESVEVEDKLWMSSVLLWGNLCSQVSL